MKSYFLRLNMRVGFAIIVSLLVVFSLLLAAPATVMADTSNDYGYSINNNQATIISYSGTGGDITLPSYFAGYPVTAIGNSAFINLNSLTSVIIPNSVTSIGAWAFRNCRYLTSVTIPDSVTSIGSYAFYGAGLTSLTIPDSVTSISIGNYAFSECGYLASITIANGATSIGDYVFKNCGRLTSITFLSFTPPTTGTGWIDGAGYRLLGHAYAGSSFPSPDSSFNGLMMGDCLPDYSYTVAGGQATIIGYKGAGGSVTLPSTLGGCPVVAVGGNSAFGNGAFQNNNNIISLIIPSSITSIGDEAFADCASLKNVTIPNSVTNIGRSAFSGTSLTSVTIPNSVTTISDRTFSACTSLTSVTIPNSVTSIGQYAFSHCFSLTKITIPNSVTNIGNEAFAYSSSLTNITFQRLTPPTTGTNWITSTNSMLLGHAYAGSSFPSPGSSFNGLTMGAYIDVPTPQVTFSASGLGNDIGSATILSIDGTSYTYADIITHAPLKFNWAEGSTHTIFASTPVPTSPVSTKQYKFSGWTNGDGLTSGSTYTIPSSDTTVTANFATQRQATFHVTGLTSDAGANTVLTVGTASYKFSDFSSGSLTVWANDQAAYSWTTNVPGVANERFITSTNTGIVTSASSGDSAAYTKQWKVTFTQTGVTSDAGTNKVLTLGASNYAYDPLPSGVWVDDGTTFAWASPIAGGSEERFILSGSPSGLASPITTAGTSSATYQKQWYITVTSAHGSPTKASQWVNDGAAFSVSVTDPDTDGAGTHRWLLAGLSISGSSQEVDDTVSFDHVTSAIEIEFLWGSQWKVTVASTHGSPDPVAGDYWVNDGTDFSVSVTTPDVVVADQHRWLLTGVTINEIPQSLYEFVKLVEVHNTYTVAFSWTEQWYISASYSTSDVSSPSANVVLSGTQAGNTAFILTLTKNVQMVWLDAGASWSVNNAIPSTTATERWFYGYTPLSGDVGPSTTIAPLFYHQYLFLDKTYNDDLGSLESHGHLGMGTGFLFGYTYMGLSRDDLNGWTGRSWLVPGTPTNSIWRPYADAGTTLTIHDVDAYWPADWPLSGVRFRYDGGQTGSRTVDSSQTIEFNYITQYLFTAQTSGLPAPSQTNIYLGGSSSSDGTAYDSIPFAKFFDKNTYTGTIGVDSVVGSYHFTGWSDGTTANPHDSVPMSEVKTLTANYVYGYTVTFSENGLPASTEWSATFNEVTHSSTTDTITFTGVAPGTGYSYSISTISVSGNERYASSPAPGTLDVSSDTPQNIVYYHQYLVTFQYSIANTPGSGFLDAMVDYYQFDISQETLAKQTSPPSDWVDAGTTIYYSMALAYRYRDQMWIAEDGAPQFLVSGPITPCPIYFHTYRITFQYTIANALGTPTDPIADFLYCGDLTHITAKQTSSAVAYVDADSSLTYTNPIVGVSGERWKISPDTSASPHTVVTEVESSQTVTPTYYHQYMMTLSYSITGGGSPTSASTFTANRLGSSFSQVLTSTATGYWFDSGSSWSVSNPLLSDHFWQLFILPSGDTSGEISAAGTINFNYYNQYSVQVQSRNDGANFFGATFQVDYTSFGTLHSDSESTTNLNIRVDASSTVTIHDVQTYYTDSDGVSGLRYRYKDCSIIGSGAIASFPMSINGLNVFQLNYVTQYEVDFSATGLDNDASFNTVLMLGGTGYAWNLLPSDVWVDSGTSYSWTDPVPVSGTEQFVKTAGSDGTVTAAGTFSATYQKQWKVTFTQTGIDSGAGTHAVLILGGTDYAHNALPSGVWVDAGTAFTWADPVAGGTNEQFVKTGQTGNSPVSSDTYSATYQKQWKQVFTSSSLGVDATGNLVTFSISGGSYSGATSPIGLGGDYIWVDDGAKVTYAFVSPVTSSVTGKQYVLTTPAPSPASGYTATSDRTLTGTYKTQYYITFAQNGVGSDFAGTVMKVDNVNYGRAGHSDWYDSGVNVVFEYKSYLTVGDHWYLWDTTSGLSAKQSDTLTISGPGTVTGNYKTIKIAYTGDASAQYSDIAAVSATVMDVTSGTPVAVPGVKIVFTIGTQTANALTLASGIAYTTITLTQQAGVYTVTATATGPSVTTSIKAIKAFTIDKETVTITYTGDTFVLTAGPTISTAPVKLSAHLDQLDTYLGDLTLAKIRFEIYKAGSSTPQIIGNIPVSASGDAYTNVNLGVEAYAIVIRIEPANSYWTQSEVGTGSVNVALGSNEMRVTGGGWIPDDSSSNGKFNFGFTVNYNKNGAPKGNFIFIIRGSGDYDYMVKSNTWNKGGLSFTNSPPYNKAFFTGQCNINKINRVTGEVTTYMSACRFAVDVTDNDLATPHTADSISISIFTSMNTNASIWRQIGTSGSPIVLGGGNVVVHSK